MDSVTWLGQAYLALCTNYTLNSLCHGGTHSPEGGGLGSLNTGIRPKQRIIAKERQWRKACRKASCPEGANQTLKVKHSP